MIPMDTTTIAEQVNSNAVTIAERQMQNAVRCLALIELLARPDDPDLISRWCWMKVECYGRWEWVMVNTGPICRRAHVWTYTGDPVKRWRRWFPILMKSIRHRWLSDRAWVEDWEQL